MKRKGLVSEISRDDQVVKEWIREMERPPQMRDVGTHTDGETPISRLKSILRKAVVIKRHD